MTKPPSPSAAPPVMMNVMTTKLRPLPGNPRSWGIEQHYVPLELAHARWLSTQLRDAGVSHVKTWSLIGWLDTKASSGEDPTESGTRAEYRKVLSELPPAPWPSRPLGSERRRTRRAVERQAGMATVRSLMAGSTAGGGLALAAGAPPACRSAMCAHEMASAA